MERKREGEKEKKVGKKEYRVEEGGKRSERVEKREGKGRRSKGRKGKGWGIRCMEQRERRKKER